MTAHYSVSTAVLFIYLFIFLFKMNAMGLFWSKWLHRPLISEEQVTITSKVLHAEGGIVAGPHATK